MGERHGVNGFEGEPVMGFDVLGEEEGRCATSVEKVMEWRGSYTG